MNLQRRIRCELHLCQLLPVNELQCNVVQLLQLQRNPYIVEPVGSATGDRVTFVCVFSARTVDTVETDPNRLQSLQVEVRKVGGPLSPSETLIPSNKRFPYWAADTVLRVYLHIMRLNAGQTAGIRCQSQEVMEITLQSETNMANRSWGFREPGGQGSGRAHSHVLSETWDSHVLPREILKYVWIYFPLKMTTFEQF